MTKRLVLGVVLSVLTHLALGYVDIVPLQMAWARLYCMMDQTATLELTEMANGGDPRPMVRVIRQHGNPLWFNARCCGLAYLPFFVAVLWIKGVPRLESTLLALVIAACANIVRLGALASLTHAGLSMFWAHNVAGSVVVGMFSALAIETTKTTERMMKGKT